MGANSSRPGHSQASSSRWQHSSRHDSVPALSITPKSTTAPASASLESATATTPSQDSSRSQSFNPSARLGHLESASAEHRYQPSSPKPIRSTPNSQRRRRQEYRQSSNVSASTQIPPWSQPVNVPLPSHPVNRPSPPVELYGTPASQYSRPPRLPLPIQEEIHTPGSPIDSAADPTFQIENLDIEDEVAPRRASLLSSSTNADDEESTADDDGVAGGASDVGTPGPAVPTLFEWYQPGRRVCVTGSFAGWNSKFRLHRHGPSKKKNALSTVINLQPGTHHLKFIVDGEMKLSNDLPTAVDFSNILVNYIEVSPDDVVPLRPHLPPPSQPVNIPGRHAAESTMQARGPEQHPKSRPDDYPPPLLFPPGHPETKPLPSMRWATGAPSEKPARKSGNTTPSKPSSNAKRYTDEIPRYLAGLESGDDSKEYERINTLISSQEVQMPPAFPELLGRNILNLSMPKKDDASLLNMPNYTQLNHLATTSIKGKVLATSVTTRYNQKFVTTILYGPAKGG